MNQRITIRSIDGREVFTGASTGSYTKINLEWCTPGVYLVQCYGNLGTTYKKVVIQ